VHTASAIRVVIKRQSTPRLHSTVSQKALIFILATITWNLTILQRISQFYFICACRCLLYPLSPFIMLWLLCYIRRWSIKHNPGNMPAVRGDGMRGLAVFISDIRNCEYIKCSWLILINYFFCWRVSTIRLVKTLIVMGMVCEKQGQYYMLVITSTCKHSAQKT
jgi:hypothetical protein